MIRTRPQPNCPLCGTAGTRLFTDVPDRLWGVPGSWSHRRCPDAQCGLVWLDPVPLPEDIGQAYQNYFTHADCTVAERPGGLAQSAYRLATALPYRLLGLHRAAERLADMFLDDLPPGRLLDVGCGDGRYLARMRDRGWTTLGVDFDARAVETARTARGLDARVGELASHRFADAEFDALTMSHVIEHVFDPVGLLAECRRILKPGGRLVAITPNPQSLGFGRFGSYWYGLDPPRHVQLFPPPSLAACARQAGCEAPQVVTTAGRAETFLAGSFKLRGEALRAAGGGGSDRSLLQRTLKTQWLVLQEALRLRSHPDCGEEAVLLYQKPA
jgi:SAM-dependent methyltransferase